MQAYSLKRSPSTPSSALLGSACLTSSMTHAGGGPENASPPDFDFNMPCRFFKSSFARSLSLNNNNSSSNNCNASKSLDYDCNNYRNNANIINNHTNNNNININADKTTIKTTTTTNCLPLPKRGAATAVTIAASQNEVSSTTTTNEVDNHIVNNNNEVNVHDVVRSNEIEVAKLPPALPARRFLSPNANYEPQQQQQKKQMAQFRTSSSLSTSTLINKVINQQQQQQQMSPPSNKINNNTSSAINGNNNQRSYYQQQQYHYHHSQQQQQQQQHQQQHGCQIWPRDVIDCQQEQDAVSNIEPRPIAAAASAAASASAETTATGFELHENTLNVEAVILQNQVDTLQWQLKQVETSCEMYRAVMEEVARFLERYTSQRQQQQQQQQQQQNRNEQQQQIARSKSLYHVHGVGGGNSTGSGSALDASSILASGDEASNSYLRARSSTNLVSGSGIGGKSMLALSEEHNYEPIAPAGSYNAFKDFTWRRTPKKGNALSATQALDAGEEKLNQEAFRLARTIHNLLNTQQADLTPRSSLASYMPGRLGKAASTSVMTLHSGVQPPLHNSTSLTANGLMDCPPPQNKANVIPKTPSLTNNVTATAASVAGVASTAIMAPDMLFLRTSNIRDSRISLRSSTDSSVHSTISSITTSSSASSSSSMKLETDEEGLTLTASPGYVGGTLKPTNNAGSSTEDESGFSSISSIQDLGIPFSSTPITSTPRGSLKELTNNQSDSRNSTLKAPMATPASTAASATAQTHPNNVIGLPLQGNVSPSKTYRNAAKYQRFSTLSNEDSATVLWV